MKIFVINVVGEERKGRSFLVSASVFKNKQQGYSKSSLCVTMFLGTFLNAQILTFALSHTRVGEFLQINTRFSHFRMH